MRVLFVSFVIDEDHPVLGWQAKVAARLAARVESVQVLTHEVGRHSLPGNCAIETFQVRPYGFPGHWGGWWLDMPRYLRIVRRARPDVCFIHMAHEWGIRLAPVLKLAGVPSVVWYAHGSVPWRLRVAERLADRLITSTPEGLRIDSPKRHVIGQAIDTDLFKLADERATDAAEESVDARGGPSTILYVGRISERKRIHLLLEVMQALDRLRPGHGLDMHIVGPVMTPEDLRYDRSLRQTLWREGLQDRVHFDGYVPQDFLPRFYETALLHLNLSETGSMDKTAMESLAAGRPLLTTNVAFREVLSGSPGLFLDSADPDMVAERILAVRDGPERYRAERMRGLVEGAHDLTSYIDRVMAQLTAAVEAH